MTRLITLNLLLIFLSSCVEKPKETYLKEGLKEVNGTQLYHKIVGKGEPILIIHGGPGLNHKYLLPHLEPLSEDYRLIFYDQRASGRSSISVDTNSIRIDNFLEDIDALRESMGIKKLNLMAHSWGGLLAMKYAIKHPDKIKSLILINSTGASSEIDAKANQLLADRFTQDDSINRTSIIQTEEFQKREPETIEKLMKIGFKHQFYEASLIDSLALELNENYDQTSRLLQYLRRDLMNYDFHKDLEAIQSPTLLIYGDYDPLTETAGKQIHRSIEHSKLRVIDNCGHFPFIEKKEKFLEIVKTFMNEKE
jgi:proline iminopeptidase